MRLAYGAILIALGVALAFWAKKRAFDRTNSSGVQQFKSAGRMIIAKSIDRTAGVAALAFIAVGALLIL